MPKISVGIACFFVLALAACSGVPERVQLNEMENNTGLLYGQIVMPNKDMVMVHIVIHQVGKTFGNMAEDAQFLGDGRFVVENLKPGKYDLYGFYMGSGGTRYQAFTGEEAVKYQVELKAGAVTYFGSYKYVSKRASTVFSPNEFRLENASSRQAQLTLLKWLEEASRGTRWHAKIQKELVK